MAGGLNRSITVRLLADTASYEAKMAKAGASAEQLAGGLEKTGSKTGMITNGLALAGAAATAFGVMAVKTFADFDASMSTVQANTGATASQMDALRQAAIDAGADTVYSASEAADGINELGKAGLSTTDILSGGLTGALNLAASDGMAVGEAAELMATTLKEFNLTGADSSKVADALAAGAGKAVGSAHDLGLALNQAGMVSHSFGISMQETTGTLAAFANSGMIGSDAGTSLKTMLISLANPSSKAAGLMEELGINAYDAQGNFIGLAGLAGVLQDKMSGLSQEQRNQALATIFGTDAIRAANVLYEQGADGINDWTKAVSESGFAAEQAAAKNDNLKGDLENLSGSIESLMISIGSGADGPLRTTVQTLDMLVDGFSQLPAPIQQAIVLATAMAGGFAAIHKAATPLTTSTSALGQSLGQLVDPVQRFATAAPLFQQAFQQIGAAFAEPTRQLEVFGTTVTRTQGVTTGLATAGQGLLAMMGGPLGLAVTAAAGTLMLFAQNAATAKQETEQWKQALQSDAGTASMITDVLSDIGDFTGGIDDARSKTMSYKDALAEVGISTQDYTNAVLGNKDAQEAYAAALDKAYKSGQISKDTQQELQAVLDENLEKIGDANDKTKMQAQIQDEVTAANQSASGAVQENSQSMSELGSSAEDATEMLDALVKSLFSVEGPALNADEAITKMNQTLLESNQTIQANGVVLDQAGNALAGHEEAAYKSQAALQSMASSAQSAAQKIMEEAQANYQASGNADELKASTDQANASLGTAREKFIEAATAAGMSEDAAKKLADQYGLIPGSVKTDIILNGADSAIGKAASLKDMLLGIPEHKYTFMDVITRHSTESKYPDGVGMGVLKNPGGYRGGLFTGDAILPGFAAGGVFDGYVDGPGTATSDSIRLLNARLAKGEIVQSASAVDYYGRQFMLDLNQKRVPREFLYKAPSVMVRETTPAASTPSLTAGQVEAAMVAALSQLPQVSVFSDGQAAAIAFAKPFSREIGRLGERGVK